MLEGFFVVSFFKERKSEVVVGGGSVILHFNGFLEVVDGGVQVTHSAVAHPAIDEGLVTHVCLTVAEVVQSSGVVVDGLLHPIQSREHQSSVEEELAAFFVFADGQIVVDQSLVQLAQLLVLNACAV